MPLAMPVKSKASQRFLPAGALALFLILILAGLGGYLWYRAGRLTFSAQTTPLSLTLASPASGYLAFVDAQEGQIVRQGQVLAGFDNGALRKRLEEQRRLLSELALALPPEAQLLPGPDGALESLTQREERRRLKEQEAGARVQAAAAAEAEAAILYQRSIMLAAKGSLRPEQRDAAERAHAEARLALSSAQADFESLSLERARSSADIRRLKELQYRSGAARLPEEQRLRAYAQAREALALSESELAGRLITAPCDGIIARIMVSAGQELEEAAPVMELTATPVTVGYRALLPSDKAAALHPGQVCRIAPSGAGKSLPGILQSVSSLPGGEEKEVWVLPLERTADGSLGAQVEISVLLREKEYSVGLLGDRKDRPFAGSAAAGSDGAGSGQAASGRAASGRSGSGPGAPDSFGAAPPQAPLSVQSPFGEAQDPLARPEQAAPPPAIRAGSPAALGLPADAAGSQPKSVDPPLLPPMAVPKKPAASALPPADNNPSIVRPSDLESHESRP